MNPILHKRANIFYYLLAWIAVSFIHLIILILNFRMDICPAVIDSLVFNTLFFSFGIAIWYPVRYIPLSKKSLFQIFLNHIVLGFLVISVWISAGYLILKTIFAANELVLQSLMFSIPFRAASGVLLFILLLLVYYLIIYSRNLRERIQREADLRMLVRDAELNMLKSQINPHFLFNSLNSASSLAVPNPEGARDMIIKLSEFLRYSLRYTELDKVLLKDEIENIHRYLEIEKVRFGNKLSFKLRLEDRADSWSIPNMILQPLFENAVKHGVYESTDPVKIEMDCRIANDFLEIEILNNYDRDSPGRKGAGIGLKNIKERLGLIYNRDDLITISKDKGIFMVKLYIPNDENTGNNH